MRLMEVETNMNREIKVWRVWVIVMIQQLIYRDRQINPRVSH